MSDEIDRLRRAPREHDFLDACRIEETTNALACAFERIGGPLTQLIDTAVYVGVTGSLVVIHGLDDREGALGGGRRVEEREPLAPHRGGED